MLITRRVEFSASHICRQPDLSAEENTRIYGEAANPHGHGHNYVVEVSLEGTPDPVTGMVLDLKELKEILNREVVTPYDHRFLNYEVPPFDRLVPTTENMPSANTMSASAASSISAATRLPLSMIVSAARHIAVPPI